jgi:tRNA nucleotidyltransferase (CCA-adding enzyme)
MHGRTKIGLLISSPALKACFETMIACIQAAGGSPVAVGGCVRDTLLGLEAKDLDVEVYGLTPDKLLAALTAAFEIDQVGMSFGVLKMRGFPIDISIPRRESKAGLGHKGFQILSDGTMTHQEAAARRDFTINAIALNPETGELIDPYSGVQDLERRILRHTSERFVEDPLRVLRAMQFAARFDFEVAPETVELCRTIEPEGLPRERIFEEWRKLMLRGVRPSRGLQFLRDSGWVRYFPELEALIGCEQEKEWHPEGDVWIHTLHCLDAFARERTGDPQEDLIVGFGVLCHDLGKPATSRFENGRIRSHGHEAAGEAPTRSFLARLTNETDLVEAVVPLVVHHLRPVELYEAQAGYSAIRRLSHRVKRIDRLVRVARADQAGRPPRVFDGFPAGDWLLERARAEKIESAAPKPIMLGRHLIELGLTPGSQFGELLEKCYQAQLDGTVGSVEQGVEFVKKLLENPTFE